MGKTKRKGRLKDGNKRKRKCKKYERETFVTEIRK
jgi:hypothetical protein